MVGLEGQNQPKRTRILHQLQTATNSGIYIIYYNIIYWISYIYIYMIYVYIMYTVINVGSKKKKKKLEARSQEARRGRRRRRRRRSLKGISSEAWRLQFGAGFLSVQKTILGEEKPFLQLLWRLSTSITQSLKCYAIHLEHRGLSNLLHSHSFWPSITVSRIQRIQSIQMVAPSIRYPGAQG